MSNPESKPGAIDTNQQPTETKPQNAQGIYTVADLDKPYFGLTDEEISRMARESNELFRRYGDFDF